MILEIFIAFLLGILAGTFTGLTPGIHINLVAAFLLASISIIPLQPIILVVFIVAMSITHTFIDFIPSILLGVPEEDTFLTVLPGHEMVKEGKGYEAILISLTGSLSSIITISILAPLFIIFLPIIYQKITVIIPFILIFISLFIIFREKEPLVGISIFFLSGLLGLMTFNLPVKEPLLPLLSGLFGASNLIISINKKTSIPKQQIITLKQSLLTKSQLIRTILISTIVTPIGSFLPGVGTGHAATIGSEIKEQTKKEFIFMIGAISTSVMALSFVTAYAIQKTRTGSAAAIQQLLNTISSSNLTIIIFITIISSITAFFIGIIISRYFSTIITKINYSKLSIIILFLLLIANLIFSNLAGIIVLITASSLGVFAILSNTRRINLMGSLLLPSIVFYLTI